MALQSSNEQLDPSQSASSSHHEEHSYPPSTSSSTLYSKSPHSKHDDTAQRRKKAARADPTWTLIVLSALVLIYWSFPGIDKPWHVRKAKSSNTGLAQPNVVVTPRMPWQKTFTLSSRGKGCHLVTDEVVRNINEGIKGTKAGILTLFIQHTSAGLTLNENFDRDVRTDMDMAMDKIVPESLPWRHTDEGPDDSASHTKASLVGSSITVPITDGRLNVGTWQGVYLCEFRAAKHSRRIVATVLP